MYPLCSEKSIDFLMNAEGAIGGFLNSKAIICGGQYKSKIVMNDCYMIDKNEAKISHKMSTKRAFASSVTMYETSIWITGGTNLSQSECTSFSGKCIPLISTEFFSFDGTKPGPDLQEPLRSHAMVNVQDHLTMIIGGQNDEEHCADVLNSEIWQYNA